MHPASDENIHVYRSAQHLNHARHCTPLHSTPSQRINPLFLGTVRCLIARCTYSRCTADMVTFPIQHAISHPAFSAHGSGRTWNKTASLAPAATPARCVYRAARFRCGWLLLNKRPCCVYSGRNERASRSADRILRCAVRTWGGYSQSRRRDDLCILRRRGTPDVISS